MIAKESCPNESCRGTLHKFHTTDWWECDHCHWKGTTSEILVVKAPPISKQKPLSLDFLDSPPVSRAWGTSD